MIGYKDVILLIAEKLDFYGKQRFKHTNKRYYEIIKIHTIPGKLESKLNDSVLKYYPYLTELYASYNPRITDAGIMGMRLTTLYATNNPNITDAGIMGMSLTTLYAYNNPNITDAGLTELKRNNPNIYIYR